MNPEKFSCIRTVDKTVKIPLWDMYTTTEYKGIEAALDKWKRQYEKQVGGIVVSYRNVSIPSRLGFHSDRGSYAIYNVRATFDVFCPKVGEIVKGKINRVSSEHIGCLIAEAINVSIRLPRDSPSGLSKYIYLDREILFEIRSFSCKPRALCVNGEVTAKCVELMDEYYPVTDEFSYEPTSQAVFGDVPSDAEDLQVNLSILGTDGKKKKGKKRGRDETEEEEENATDSPRVKKIKKDLDLTGSLEEEASSTDTPKKGKSSTKSPKPKKSKKGLISTNSPGMNQVDGDISSIDTPKKGKKHKKKSPMDSPKPKKSLIFANGPEMTQEGGDTSSTDSPKVKQIQRLQEEFSFIDTPKKPKKKKSSSTDSPKLSQEDSSSTESAKKMVPKSTDSSQESQSSSTESDKKEKKKLSNKKTKKKASKSTENPTKIKKELLSSTEDEGSKKKSKKKPKKKSKDSAKPKDKKKSSKKKGKVTASGDILKKDKKKSKKSSKKDDKSKKKNKDKSEKKKKTKLSNDGDVTLKEIKSEGM